MNSNDFIAVFDSGVGGISVLRHLVSLLPRERYLYFGDSANAPYGTKSKEEVKRLTFAAAEKLQKRGIKALVVACNTATSAAIAELRAAYPELIVIGIEPALKLAADRFPGGHLGVMATPMTLREEKFARLLERFEQNHTIHKIPAPGLVELIEQGKGDSPEAETLLSRLFAPYIGQLDALVLGCTHYPFAAPAITRVLGENVALLDGGEGTARETRRRLKEAGLLRQGAGEVIIENSAGDDHLLTLSRQLLGEIWRNKMQYESLIFDIDGTLWDSRALVAEGYNIQLKKEGLDHLCIDAETLRPLFGKVMTAIADAIFPDLQPDARYALMERCMDTENRYLFENECNIGYPNVKETLAELAKHYRLFIVSNSQCGYPELCIDKLGLADYIEGHMCFGDTGTSKGQTIRTLIKRHNIGTCIYIGDTQGDYEATQEAGIPFIFAAYGLGQADGYDAKIKKIEELLTL